MLTDDRGTAPKELWPLTAKAAIFDFDGTLADTAQIWHEVDRTFLGKRDLEVPTDYAERVAALGFEQGARYTIERFGLADTVREIMAEWTELSEAIYRSEVRLRPGVTRYLKALGAASVPCALATTNHAEVLGQMEHVRLDSLFDACVFGSEVARSKEHPDIFIEAARRLGVEAQDCIVFEDNVRAARSARRAGAICCGVRADDPNQDVAGLRAESDLWLDDWRDIACAS